MTDRNKDVQAYIRDQKRTIEAKVAKWYDSATAIAEKYEDAPEGASFNIGYSCFVALFVNLGTMLHAGEYDDFMAKLHFWRQYLKTKNKGYTDLRSVTPVSAGYLIGYVSDDAVIAFTVKESELPLFLDEGCRVETIEGRSTKRIVCDIKEEL